MLQQTSLEAWIRIQAELGEKQAHVFSVFKHSREPLTNMEVASLLGWSINRVTPRVFELRERGLLKEACKRPCSITGRMAIAWKKTLRCLGEQFE